MKNIIEAAGITVVFFEFETVGGKWGCAMLRSDLPNMMLPRYGGMTKQEALDTIGKESLGYFKMSDEGGAESPSRRYYRNFEVHV